MDAQLVAWLNADAKPYDQGIALYKRLGNNPADLEYFLQAHTRASAQKLFDSLRAIYYQLKQGKNHVSYTGKMVAEQPKGKTNAFVPANALEVACKQECDKVYKEMMNVRAQLFALCPLEKEWDENQENAIRLRELYTQKILEMQPLHQAAMDKLQYVKEHGKLPDTKPMLNPTLDDLNPLELERKRVNLMKAMSKLRLKQQTPERVQLMQKHEASLKQVQHAIDQLK